MPRYFLAIKNGISSSTIGNKRQNDTDAIDMAKLIAIGVSLDSGQ